MVFQVGDTVRFLNESGSGVVTSIDGSTVFVEVDGFDMPYPADELIATDGSTTRFITIEREFEKQGSAELKTRLKKRMNPKLNGAMSDLFKRINQKGIPEIDLHIEELVESYSGLTNGEIVTLQLDYLTYTISQARENKVRELVVIHGVGEGVLRKEIRQYLDSFQNVEYWDAAYRIYGHGATHVKIRG